MCQLSKHDRILVHLILQQPCKVEELLSASFYGGVGRRWHPGFGLGRPAPGSVLLTTVDARQLSWSLCRKDGQVKQHSSLPTPWPHALWGASLVGWAGSALHSDERPGPSPGAAPLSLSSCMDSNTSPKDEEEVPAPLATPAPWEPSSKQKKEFRH